MTARTGEKLRLFDDRQNLANKISILKRCRNCFELSTYDKSSISDEHVSLKKLAMSQGRFSRPCPSFNSSEDSAHVDVHASLISLVAMRFRCGGGDLADGLVNATSNFLLNVADTRNLESCQAYFAIVNSIGKFSRLPRRKLDDDGSTVPENAVRSNFPGIP